MRKKRTPKPRPIPRIDYPPLTTKTWIPPSQRKIKPRTKSPPYPPVLHANLEPSSLKKVWHNFKVVRDAAILLGNYSMHHHRYSYVTNGFQGSANCVAAILYSKLLASDKWSSQLLDTILDVGDHFYLESKKSYKLRQHLKINELSREIYIHNFKITIDFKGKKVMGMLYDSSDGKCEYLYKLLLDFFVKSDSGIISTITKEPRYFAIWKFKNGYFLFDPSAHDEMCWPWQGTPGGGVSILVRFLNLAHLLQVIQRNLGTSNMECELIPIGIERIVFINTRYPVCMEENQLEQITKVLAKLNKDQSSSDLPKLVVSKNVDEVEDKSDEKKVVVSDNDDLKKGQKDEETKEQELKSENEEEENTKVRIKPPLTKVRVPSVTFFNSIVPERIGIISAETHQEDQDFQKCPGKHAVCNAISALTMLRQYKSKYWTPKIVNNVLRLGYRICIESKRKLIIDEKPFNIMNVTKKITLEKSEYTPVVSQYSAVGKLRSTDESILELLPALKELFKDCDNIVIQGPLIVSVWKEDDNFYMFDPQERDPNGLAIIKEIRTGSVVEAVDFISGTACLLKFADIRDLVEMYLKNVPKENRRDPFILSNVEIKDYEMFPDNWGNFVAIGTDRWILRGDFSQGDLKFENEIRNYQCMANCIMAITFNQIVSINEWDSNTMNIILNSGSLYYINCIQDLMKKNKFVSPKLILSEVLPEFLVDSKLACVDFDECYINGYISTPENKESNLLKGLEDYFKENDHCIVSARGIAVALWRKGGAFYYFDSHDRDELGFRRIYGTSCIQRILTIPKLTECMLSNLAPTEEPCIYNIHRISVSLYEPPPLDAPKDEDDDTDFEDENEISLRELFNVEMPLYNYTKLTNKRAILRAKHHQGDKTMFGPNAGNQTLGNLVAVIGMSKIFDPKTWDVEILDDILRKGYDIFKETMEQIYDKPQGIEEEPQRELKIQYNQDDTEGEKATEKEVEEVKDKNLISTENIKKDFKIGINKLTLDFEDLGKGIIGDRGDSMTATIKEVFQNVDEESKYVLLQVNDIDVVLWKEGLLYFIFDPKGRDEFGDTYGKNDWSQISLPTETDEIKDDEKLLDTQNIETINKKVELEDDLTPIDAENDDTPVENIETIEEQPKNVENIEVHEEKIVRIENMEQGEIENEIIEDNIEDELIEPEEVPPKKKISESFWKEKENTLGRTYVMWSTKLIYLLRHILNNVPPKLRNEISYKLMKISVLNVPEVKNAYDEEMGPKMDNLDGDWNDFKEIVKGQWILRGTMYQSNKLFPVNNRNKQSDANCLISIAYACLYQQHKFDKYTVDSILKYGDRLLTSTKKLHRKELQKSQTPILKDFEIEEIIKTQNYSIDKLLKTFCIGDDTISISIEYNFIVGELQSTFEEFPDLPTALEKFFQGAIYGVLSSKGTSVGVWKIGDFYYMFDPCSRGPSGRNFENGVACITRFLQTQDMADIISENLPRFGQNFFTIHLLKPQLTVCDKLLKVEQRKPDDPLKIVGFAPVTPGKFVIRGRLNLDHQSFGRGTNMQAAPIATVALAMTLIHNCEYWTAPIIDEVITIGDRIYGEIVEKCEYSFNPWEEKLSVSMCPKDFKIGKIKVNFEIRNTEQAGTVNVKEIRLGMERFFKENCYGVIDTEFLTVAIWQGEDDVNRNYIYMFDPYSRSLTGQVQEDGGAGCVIKCNGPKILADHIISLLHNSGGQEEFTITPIEIVIERDGKCKKTKNYGVKLPIKCSKTQKLGRYKYYAIPNKNIEIIRGTRSQYHENYSLTSRGNQDVPNCIISYVMDKLIPLHRWTYKIIDMLLDIGDQLYKDSYIIYNPKDKKLRLETLIRDIIIKDVRVKISVGAPVLTAKFTTDLVNDALDACFNLKSFCIVLVNRTALSIFKKEDAFYLFSPDELSLEGIRCKKGAAAVLKIPDIPAVINVLMGILDKDADENEVFHVIVVGVREIEKICFGDNSLIERNNSDIKCNVTDDEDVYL